MSVAEFRALRAKHAFWSSLFKSFKAAGQLEAAEAAFWSAQRVWQELSEGF